MSNRKRDKRRRRQRAAKTPEQILRDTGGLLPFQDIDVYANTEPEPEPRDVSKDRAFVRDPE